MHRRGVEDLETQRARGVHDQLTRPPGAGEAQAADQRGQGVVGDGEQDEVRVGRDLVRRADRHPGQQAVGPASRGVGDRADGDDV